MSPRTLLALVVCAAIAACQGPETFHESRSGLGHGGAGAGGTAGMSGATGSAGIAVAGAAGDTSGTAGVSTAGAAGVGGAGTAGSTPGTAGMTAGQAGVTGTAGAGGMAGKGTAGTTGTAGAGGAGGMGTAGMVGTAGMGGAGGKAGAGGATAGAGGAGGAGGAAGTGGAGGAPLPTLRIDSASMTANAPFAGAIDVTAANAAPQAVYQTTRIGAFSYTIPGYTANSMHTVRLHFAETYFPPAGDTMGGAGRRICNVTINGAAVLTGYDIFVKAGNAKMKAVVETFSLAANGTGQYVIQFTPTKDNCALGGLEVQ